jgi:hypothetical protein
MNGRLPSADDDLLPGFDQIGRSAVYEFKASRSEILACLGFGKNDTRNCCLREDLWLDVSHTLAGTK